jgi:erythromycin esterase
MTRTRTAACCAYITVTIIASAAVSAAPTAAQALPENTRVIPDLSNDPRVQWLKQHAAAVRTIDPADTDYRDLEALGDVIGDARVVLLGEGTHNAANTFTARSRIVQFLHQERGFDVLVWESGLYSVAKSWERMREGEDALTAMRRSVFGIWTRVEEVQPLIAYIDRHARSDRPLEIAGLDSQLTGTASRDFLTADLRDYMATIGGDTTLLSEGGLFDVALRPLTLVGGGAGINPPDPWFEDSVATLQRQIQGLRQPGNAEAAFWTHVLDGMRLEASGWRDQKVIARTEEEKERATWRAYIERDVQMARNLIWLVQERYAGRKLIVWAATMHTNYREPNPQFSEEQTLERYGLPWRPMGQIAHQALGDETYAIGFTAYEGVRGADSPIEPTRDTVEFEDLMHATGLVYGFVDLRAPAAGGEWLRTPMYARPYGLRPHLVPWAEVLDGLFYMRTEKGATRILQ